MRATSAVPGVQNPEISDWTEAYLYEKQVQQLLKRGLLTWSGERYWYEEWMVVPEEKREEVFRELHKRLGNHCGAEKRVADCPEEAFPLWNGRICLCLQHSPNLCGMPKD